MIWVILAAIGVPLWLCAMAITVLVFRNRALRKRPGNLPVRVLAEGKRRWVPGHAVWVHDVFVFRGSPAAWKEELLWVTGVLGRDPTESERRGLHRIGDDPVVASMKLASGQTVEVAARGDQRNLLLGPFSSE